MERKYSEDLSLLKFMQEKQAIKHKKEERYS